MNYNIDEMIKQTENMQNVSDGGSPCYAFDQVVLVKYTMPIKYGRARKNEEIVAEFANKKNEMGVNTPKHLEIKRVVKLIR